MDEFDQNPNTPAAPAGMPPVVSPPNPQKSKLWKFAAWFVGILVVAVAGLWALGDYERSRSVEEFERWAEDTRQAMENFEARKAADTFGGVTPQETLRMYIEAVEKGDYELASKYFVLEKQENELKRFTESSSASAEQILQYLSILRGLVSVGGQYSESGDSFSFNGDVLISMSRYPNGVWKIIEI